MTTLVTALFGVAQGLRHAFEPDHLAAVTTLASQARSRRSGVWLGALWGLGHATTLLVVGGSLAVLGRVLPERAAQSFELLVAAMLVGLGLRAVAQARTQGRAGQVHAHAHGEVHHAHASPDAHVHLRGRALATRPLLVGVVHGLAGSGALTAAVLARQPDTASRLGAIACFGLGALLGMSAVSGVLGVPLLKLREHPRAAAGLLLAVGLSSLALGVSWGFDAAFALGAQPPWP